MYLNAMPDRRVHRGPPALRGDPGKTASNYRFGGTDISGRRNKADSQSLRVMSLDGGSYAPAQESPLTIGLVRRGSFGHLGFEFFHGDLHGTRVLR